MAKPGFLATPQGIALTGNLSGATLSAFLGGTTTPTNFYSDKTLLTSLGATLTADSTGRFSNFFLPSDADIKLRLVHVASSTDITFDYSSIADEALDATLLEFADALSATGKVPYASAPGVLAEADSQAYGRSLWNTANAAAALDLLNASGQQVTDDRLARTHVWPSKSIIGWYGIEPLRISQSVVPGFEKTSDSVAGFSEAYYREFLAYLFGELDAEGVYLLYLEYLGLTFTNFGFTLGTHYDTTADYQGYWAGLGSPATTANFDWLTVTLEVAEAYGKGVMVPMGGRGGDTALLNDRYLINKGTKPAQSLTFGASTGSGVTVTAGGAIFSSADVGKRIVILTGAGEALITGYTSTTVVTVTITTTISDTTPASQEWALRNSDLGNSGPIALTLSATSGSSVTVTTSPLVTGFFNTYHIGKQIVAGSGVGKITAVAGNGQTCTINVSAAFASTSLSAAGWTLGASLTTRQTTNYALLQRMAQDLYTRGSGYSSFVGWFDARETDDLETSAGAYYAVAHTPGTYPAVSSYGLPIMFSGASPLDLASSSDIPNFATNLLASGLDIWAPQTSSLYGYDYVTGLTDWSTGAGTGIANNLSQLPAHFLLHRQAVDKANAWSFGQARNIRLWGLVEPMQMDGSTIGNEYPAAFEANIFLQMIRLQPYCDKLITGQSLGAFSKATHSYRPKQSASGFADYRTRAEALGTDMTTFVSRQRQKWKPIKQPIVIQEGVLDGATGTAAANATTDYSLGTVRPQHPGSELLIASDVQVHSSTLTGTYQCTVQLRANGTLVGVQTFIVEVSGYWSPAVRLNYKVRHEGVAQALEARFILPASSSALTIDGAQTHYREVFL